MYSIYKNFINYVRSLTISPNPQRSGQKIENSLSDFFPKAKIDSDVDEVFANKIQIKIILILDSDKILNLNFLDKFNVEIHYSFNSVEALKIISLNSVLTFDAIILNCTGKDVNVLSLINFISNTNAPIIAISNNEDRQMLLDQGINIVINNSSNINRIVTQNLFKLLKIPSGLNNFSKNDIRESKQTASKPFHILLVDDSLVCLKIFSKYLRTDGLNVTECFNAKKVIEYIKNINSKFDLIIIDEFMLFMVRFSKYFIAAGFILNSFLFFNFQDGICLVDVMNKVLDSPIPMIVMSCSSESTVDVDRVKASSFLKKPFDKKTLMETIYSTLDNKVSQPTPIYQSSLKRFFPPHIQKLKKTVVPQISYSITTNQSNMRAIIVDDSIVGLKLLGKIISGLGYDTDLFTTGIDAYAHIEKNIYTIPYDLIITDIDMPGLDGILLIDVCRNILNLDVPIIVISSDFRSPTQQEAKSIGADAFLVKPVSKEVILQTFSTFKHNEGKILDHIPK